MKKLIAVIASLFSFQSPLIAQYVDCNITFEKKGYPNAEVVGNPEVKVFYHVRNNFDDPVKNWTLCRTESAEHFFSDINEGIVYCNGKPFFKGKARGGHIYRTPFAFGGYFYDSNGNKWPTASWARGNQESFHMTNGKGCFYDPTKSLYFDEIEHTMSAYLDDSKQYILVSATYKTYYKTGKRIIPNFENSETKDIPKREDIKVPIKFDNINDLFSELKMRKELCKKGGYWKKNECYYYDQLRDKMTKMGLELPSY